MRHLGSATDDPDLLSIKVGLLSCELDFWGRQGSALEVEHSSLLVMESQLARCAARYCVISVIINHDITQVDQKM